jgi:hypothetical protein
MVSVSQMCDLAFSSVEYSLSTAACIPKQLLSYQASIQLTQSTSATTLPSTSTSDDRPSGSRTSATQYNSTTSLPLPLTASSSNAQLSSPTSTAPLVLQMTSPSSSNQASESLHEFFMSKYSRPTTSSCKNLLATKRRKIHRHAAVITQEEFTHAIEEIKSSTHTSKKKSISKPYKSPSNTTSSEEDQEEIPLPPPLAVRSKAFAEKKDRECQNSKVGDYVILQLQPDGKRKVQPVFYAGFVLRQQGEDWEISCLRRHNESVTQFYYPKREDVSLYSDGQIVMHLHEPKKVRDVYHFSDDLSQYASFLR